MLPSPPGNLLGLLLIALALFFQVHAPLFEIAGLEFETLYLALLCLHLLFILFLRFQKIICGILIVFDLEQCIKFLFALTSCFQKNRGEGALRYTKGISKERFKGTFAINAKKFVQLILHIGTLFNTRVSLEILDRPKSSGPTTSIDYVRAIIAANEVNNDMPILLAFSYKLRLVIGQKVEEGKTNSFYDGAFARSIGSTDSSGDRKSVV